MNEYAYFFYDPPFINKIVLDALILNHILLII